MADKEAVPASAGTFPTDRGLFVGLLIGVILIVGGLTFFPSLALGPVAEHFAGAAGQTFGAGGKKDAAPPPRQPKDSPTQASTSRPWRAAPLNSPECRRTP